MAGYEALTATLAMYFEFYGLKEAPFSITPDPRFVYLSERHRDALAHLLFGIGQGGSGGFVQLTGEVGTGKTTLSRLLLEQLPEDTQAALVLNPRLSPEELLQTICEELGVIDREAGEIPALKPLIDRLNAHLLRAYADGKRVVVLIDEAQELSRAALEQVRLLTNLETSTQKLLQIVLLGQPELRERLAEPDLRQLAQRITARYHLTPLDAEETEAYLRHRLLVAGCPRFPFTRLAVKRIHAHSGGVPRLINVIAERALLAGYARDQNPVGERLVDRAAAEALSPMLKRNLLTRRSAPHLAWPVAAGLAAVIAVIWLWPTRPLPVDGPVAAGSNGNGVARTTAVAVPALDAQAFSLRLMESEGGDLPAWNRLLALWHLRAEQAEVGVARTCPPMVAPGVFCLRGSGTLSRIAALGRPTILPLRFEGRTIAVIVVGLDALRVRLVLGGEVFDVDRTQLERYWRGEFYTLWRAPDFVSLPIRRGDTGPAVDWLWTRLMGPDQADPELASMGPQRYDQAMAERVRALQQGFGLFDDGVVGPETLLAIASALPEGPVLRRQL